MNILCLDGGSSTLKYALFEFDANAERRLVQGTLGRSDAAGAVGQIFDSIAAAGVNLPDAVGHRIVFGGPDHVSPALATTAVLADLERFVPIDPLHLRAQLDLAYATTARIPGAVQVLCFDSAFHRRMPAVAQRFPLPRSLGRMIRRYGFHGLSYEYIVSALGADARGRVLIAHLGSGCSLAAVRDGEPLDTTMGFSPLGGVMMSTRPGDLDPGALLYLFNDGRSASDLAELLNERSGLLGVSETSGDMQTLLRRADDDERAREAIELFVYQIRKHAGALTSILGGLDVLVFTGGIGENSQEMRARIAGGLAHLGAFAVRVIPTDEVLMIARHTRTVVSGSAPD